MNDYEIKAYVTNLGKYNEGELVGEWVSFPVTPKEMEAVYDRIGIGHPDDFGIPYEEVFVTDYDIEIYGIAGILGEYSNLEELNYLAGRLEDMPSYEMEKFKAVLESGIGLPEDGVSGLINLTYNLDRYDVIPDVHDDSDLGYYYVEDSGIYDTKSMGALANYIDYESFGRDVRLEEGGMYSDTGYIRDEGSSWEYEYDGTRESIPDEYRLSLKEEPLFPEETIKKAMEAAGYTYDAIESSDGHLRFFGSEHMLQMYSWNEAAEWLEGVVFDDPQVSDQVEGILHPERFARDRYSIYQLDHDKPQIHTLSFASYSEVQKMGMTVEPKNYVCVYHDTLKPGETLDSIYERFNLHHPADFRGHSLSVSDVIVLHQSGVDTAYYVDSFGFKQVPEFTAHNPLEKVEELLEDDYGMIDGIINNGSKKDEQEKDGGRKPSVLDKLKEKKQEAEELAQKAMPVPKKDRSEIDL